MEKLYKALGSPCASAQTGPTIKCLYSSYGYVGAAGFALPSGEHYVFGAPMIPSISRYFLGTRYGDKEKCFGRRRQGQIADRDGSK
jgi:hypothetical protein